MGRRKLFFVGLALSTLSIIPWCVVILARMGTIDLSKSMLLIVQLIAIFLLAIGVYLMGRSRRS